MNEDLNNFGFGIYYTQSSVVVVSLRNRPEPNVDRGEIVILSCCDYGGFQIAAQTIASGYFFRKRCKYNNGSFTEWSNM